MSWNRHVYGQAYCSEECLFDALGEASTAEALRSVSPFLTDSKRTPSRGSARSGRFSSSGTDSRSGGTNYDYSTSDADYETQPTTEGNDESQDGSDSDIKFPQFFPRRRGSGQAPASRRTSPLVS